MVTIDDILIKEEAYDFSEMTRIIRAAVLLKVEQKISDEEIIQDISIKDLLKQQLKYQILNHIYEEIFVNYHNLTKEVLELIHNNGNINSLNQIRYLMDDFQAVMKKRIYEPKEKDNGKDEKGIKEKDQK